MVRGIAAVVLKSGGENHILYQVCDALVTNFHQT